MNGGSLYKANEIIQQRIKPRYRNGSAENVMF